MTHLTALKRSLSRVYNSIKQRVKAKWVAIAPRFMKHVTVSTAQGTLTVNCHEFLGRTILVNRNYEIDLVTNTVEYLRAQNRLPARGSGTVYDIGANVGIIGIGLLLRGEFSRGVFFEPEPNNFRLLARNIRQNGLTKLSHISRAALTSFDGQIEMELSAKNHGDHRIRMGTNAGGNELFSESRRSTIAVGASKLDTVYEQLSVQLPPPALVWVDIQGHEGFLFEGGKAFFSRGMPIVSELWPYGILRSGFTIERFCGLCSSIWDHFVEVKDGSFQRYPIAQLKILFDTIGLNGGKTNLIFLKSGTAEGVAGSRNE